MVLIIYDDDYDIAFNPY